MTDHTDTPVLTAESVADVLVSQGVFKGAHGLEGLAQASEFWEQQPYGTRLYYGAGIADYLHRGVLETAVRALTEIPGLRAEADKVDVLRRNRDRLAIENGSLREQCDRLLAKTRELTVAIEIIGKSPLTESARRLIAECGQS